MSDRLLPLLCIAGLAFLAACSGPAPQPAPLPIELPDTYDGGQGSQTEPSTAGWWTRFENPGLTAAVEGTLADNLDLMAAAARVQRAAALAKAAGGEALPQLSAGLGGSRSRTNLIGLPIPGAPEVLPIQATNFGLSLDLSWELDLWGRLSAVRDRAEAGQYVSLAQYQAARLSLAGQAAKTWLAWSESGQQQMLAESALEIAESTAASLEAAFARGTVDASTLRQARSEVARAQSRAVEALRLHEEVGRQLQILQGKRPSRLEGELAELPALPAPIPAGLPAELLSRRPDLVAAEANYRAAAAGLREAQASLYPRISLTGSVGTASNDLTDLVDGDFQVWSFAGNLFAPLFQGGRLRANVDVRRAELNEAAAGFGQSVLRALAEVEIALRAETLLADRVQSLATAEQAAAEDLAQRRRRFAEGAATAVQVWQSKATWIAARSELLSAQHALLRNRIDLHLALGGDFRTTASR